MAGARAFLLIATAREKTSAGRTVPTWLLSTLTVTPGWISFGRRKQLETGALRPIHRQATRKSSIASVHCFLSLNFCTQKLNTVVPIGL